MLFSDLSRMSKHNREEVLQKAEKDLAAVTDQFVARLVKELQGTDFWKLRRAYSPGVSSTHAALLRCVDLTPIYVLYHLYV